MKKRIILFFPALILILSLCLAFGYAETLSASGGLTYRDAGGKFTITATDGVLYLPASASYADLRGLGLAEGTVVSDGQGREITVGADGALDLTELFGAMTPGTLYPVQIGGVEYRLIQSEAISSIHITSDVPLETLHLSKENTGSGTVTMIRPDGTAVQDSKGNEQIKLKKIKGRGNNSWNHSGDKIAYNINLDKKAELIGGAGAAKKWCLLSNNVDNWDSNSTDMSNFIGYTMAQRLGIDYAISFEGVDLYINGEYRGVYMLTEKVEVGESRVPIRETEYSDDENPVRHVVERAGNDPTLLAGIQKYSYFTGVVQDGSCGGFLIERDYYVTKEEDAAHFVTRNGIPFGIKSPEYPSQEQVQKIAMFVQDWEDAMFSETGFNEKGRYYTDYMELDSVVRMFALEVFTNEPDYDYSSMYYSVDWDGSGELTEKLHCGPAWDLDLCHYRNYMHGSTPYATDRLKLKTPFLQLMQHGDFAQAFYDFVKPGTAFEQAWNRMIETDFSAYVAKTAAAQAMNDLRWGRAQGYYASCAEEYLGNVAKRQADWYGKLFTGDKLLGVTVSNDGGTLTANVTGRASSYGWYRLGNSSLLGMGASYTPTETGTYYVRVSGTGIDPNQPELLTEMTSNPLQVDEIRPSDAPGIFSRISALLTEWLLRIVSLVRNLLGGLSL